MKRKVQRSSRDILKLITWNERFPHTQKKKEEENRTRQHCFIIFYRILSEGWKLIRVNELKEGCKFEKHKQLTQHNNFASRINL